MDKVDDECNGIIYTSDNKKPGEKCMMCKKSFIIIKHAIHCKKCSKYLHKGCLKRTIVNIDHSFQYCCLSFYDNIQKIDKKSECIYYGVD